jgi:hypothetical protein
MVFNLTYNKEGKPYEAAPQALKKETVYQFPQRELSMVAEEPAQYGEKKEDK